MKIMKPFPYQRTCLDTLGECRALDPNVWRLAVVMATGLGKTVTFAHEANEHVQAHGTRVLVLVHTDELTRQAVSQLHDCAPGLDVGVVKATTNQVGAQVIVASVATLAHPNRRAQITNVGLVIVDECHHATAPTYQAILGYFGCLDFTCSVGDRCECRGVGCVERTESDGPPTPCTGYTATLARGDGVSLAGVWQDVAFVRGISWAIRHRYLIPIRGVAIKVPDLRLSAPVGADFSDQVLGDALAESFAPDVVAQAYLEHAAGRKGVAFWPTVALAQQSADAFNAAGIKTEVVHGELPDTERAAILERLESGVIQMVSNCMVLGEGWDEPSISLVIIGRPTQSKTLYQQMCGRGPRVDRSRPYDEQDCLIMTVVPMTSSMTLRSLVDLSDKPIVDDGTGTKTLTQLEDEYDLSHQLEPDPEHHYAGPVVAEPFDPLAAASQRIWARTDGGVKYLRAGEGALVFLLATEPGRYRVAWCMTRSVPYRCHLRLHDEECQALHDRKGAITEYGGDLETAMGWAEDVAISLGADPLGTYGRKAAPWRANIPDVGMLTMATRYGIDVTPYTREGGDRRGNKSGRLSDLINQRIASRRIDPLIPALLKSLEPADAR